MPEKLDIYASIAENGFYWSSNLVSGERTVLRMSDEELQLCICIRIRSRAKCRKKHFVRGIISSIYGIWIFSIS